MLQIPQLVHEQGALQLLLQKLDRKMRPVADNLDGSAFYGRVLGRCIGSKCIGWRGGRREHAQASDDHRENPFIYQPF
ncbi:hypothetical protein I532_15161 [Brevibacillus borstelensis AK1]|uniref:Uncharacterized protein n=1 Tax=Brevibacillus borstelensis AK1 TaxID=1300222 RepID=M8DE04_9BACL|nr:hypothetical protein I532_15161 [Brevibacillus borstelensis AK1]